MVSSTVLDLARNAGAPLEDDMVHFRSGFAPVRFAIGLEGVVTPILRDDDYDRLEAQAAGAGKLFPSANLVHQT